MENKEEMSWFESEIKTRKVGDRITLNGDDYLITAITISTGSVRLTPIDISVNDGDTIAITQKETNK